MFDVEEDIEAQLGIARRLVTVVSNCGYNAGIVQEERPGDEMLDGDAIFNTLYLALDAL